MKKNSESRRFYSMKASVVLFVFIIMVLSGFMSGTIILILHYFFGQFSRFQAPLVLIASCLIVSAILGTCISAAVGKLLLKPVRDVIKAMKQVEKGNFSVRVDDYMLEAEVNELVDSYNKMAEELSGVEMFRENFVNSFSHEFKTPIVSIEGFAKQLKKDNLSEEKKKEYVDIIITESRRLTNLSTSILMLTRFENQQIITDKVRFSLDEQIRSCILLLEKQWQAKDIDFDIDMDEISFTTNEEMMSQVWLNVIGNAIKFSPERCTIKIKLHREKGKISAHISDCGIGMNEDTIKHIFERFYQGDKAHSAEGNGLGLPLVKRIVELCGGQIRVESQYGKGTDFIITLPLSPN